MRCDSALCSCSEQCWYNWTQVKRNEHTRAGPKRKRKRQTTHSAHTTVLWVNWRRKIYIFLLRFIYISFLSLFFFHFSLVFCKRLELSYVTFFLLLFVHHEVHHRTGQPIRWNTDFLFGGDEWNTHSEADFILERNALVAVWSFVKGPRANQFSIAKCHLRHKKSSFSPSYRRQFNCLFRWCTRMMHPFSYRVLMEGILARSWLQHISHVPIGMKTFLIPTYYVNRGINFFHRHSHSTRLDLILYPTFHQFKDNYSRRQFSMAKSLPLNFRQHRRVCSIAS